MESLLARFEQRPSWASNWCYFYLLSAALTALTAILTLMLAIFSFSELSKKGSVSKVFLYLVAFCFQSVTSMVMFWMCRSSLKDK